MHDKMKKCSYIWVICFLFVNNIVCQDLQTEIYSALNDVIDIYKIENLNQKSRHFNFSDISSDDLKQWCKGDSILSKVNLIFDTVFIDKQINEFKTFRWNCKRINRSVKLTKSATHYITVPLFINRKLDTFVIYHREYNGPEAASGLIEIYKRMNNVWLLYCIIPQWIS